MCASFNIVESQVCRSAYVRTLVPEDVSRFFEFHPFHAEELTASPAPEMEDAMFTCSRFMSVIQADTVTSPLG